MASATTFVWAGRTLAGERRTGELVAPSQADAVRELRKLRVVVSSLRPKPRAIGLKLPFHRGVGIHDQVVFTRQFATMINAGLPLVSCLDVLAKQTENRRFGAVIAECMRDVEAGSTLTEAVRKHPRIFSDLYVNMIAAGEAGGMLDTILGRLAEYLEKNEALRRRVKGAMTYPLVVFGAALLSTTFMLLFVIPTFAKVFSDFGGELPVPTRIDVVAVQRFQ